jgi:predicted O-methyltransferase YrrM
MTADSHTFQTAYDARAALNYLASLHAPLKALPVTGETISGERIQPTVGAHAAALLDVLVRSRRPQRILEIGTSFGYSACVLGHAAATYGGRVWTIERRETLAQAARENLAASGLRTTVNVVVGDARQIVGGLNHAFGLILQDESKEDYLPLLDPLVERLELGGLLVSDDVLFPVMNLPESAAHWAQAMSDYNRALADHPQLRSVWLPIGDGVALSVKIE